MSVTTVGCVALTTLSLFVLLIIRQSDPGQTAAGYAATAAAERTTNATARR